MREMKTKNCGTNSLMFHDSVIEMRPTELHMKEDGSIDDKPSFCFVAELRMSPHRVIMQVSLRMLNEAMNELGYEIKSISTPNPEGCDTTEAEQGDEVGTKKEKQ